MANLQKEDTIENKKVFDFGSPATSLSFSTVIKSSEKRKFVGLNTSVDQC